MQLSRALRGAALSPQTAQQNLVLRFFSHGENGTHLHVLGHWFLLAHTKQLLLSQLWLCHIQSLGIVTYWLFQLTLSTGRNSWGCVSRLPASLRSCKTHSIGHRVILLLSWGDPAKPRKETETEAPWAFWNQKPLRYTKPFVLEISSCQTHDFLRAPSCLKLSPAPFFLISRCLQLLGVC